jgi:hypothetical protein
VEAGFDCHSCSLSTVLESVKISARLPDGKRIVQRIDRCMARAVTSQPG